MRRLIPLVVLLLGCNDEPADVTPDAGRDAGTDAAERCIPAPATSPLEVVTTAGTVRGVDEDGVRAFRGIPFAAPPIGALRWRAPEPAACWEDVRPATSYRAMCTQIGPTGAVVGDEDCLTLNVWSPAPSADARLPVMVWIHGGDNIIGSASDDAFGEPVYRGTRLARRADAVVVVIQYRLAAFGFLDHPALADESGIRGNFGTLDQIAALAWVRDNIAAFGGDPARVTIFGQSAGGDAVCALVASPRARGLFAGAIFHSGACHTSLPAVRTATAISTERALGCEGAADIAGCMRGATTDAVAQVPGGGLDSAGAADFYITVDGVVLPASPMSIIDAGDHAHVPIIVMATRDEYLSLMDLVVTRPLEDQADFEAYVRESFGEAVADFVIERYPVSRFPSAGHAFVAALSDALYHCPNRTLLRSLRGRQTEPVYRLMFSSAFDDPRLAPYGAGHGMDVAYVFDTFGGIVLSPAERALSDAMIESWAAFATTGDPATATLPAPIYDPARDNYLDLDDTSTVRDGFRTALCDGWDAFL